MREKQFKKIRISGGSGSGKTFLGNKLSHALGISSFPLDEITYDFTKKKPYNNKRSHKERKALLKRILQDNQWIIEGSYYTWSQQSYKEADIIIYLRTPLVQRLYNTFRRYMDRIKTGENETISNFLDLTKYNLSSRKKWHSERYNQLKKDHAGRLHAFRTADQAYEWFIKNES